MTLASAVVDHSPPSVDHVGLIAGTPWTLVWLFGPEGTPENLTGQFAKLYINDILYTPSVDGLNGKVSIAFTAAQTALFTATGLEYLLLLQGDPQVRGVLYIADRLPQ